MNRSDLIDAYAQQILDSMDMKTLEQYAYDMLVNCFEGYTAEELITEISDHYPELLEGWLLTMETTYDFVDLETEWQDDLLIPAADDDESEANFRQFINSNIDFWIIMSKALLISMLRKGQTGNEILSILDMLADESDDTMSEPTLDEIEFWLVLLINQGLDRLSPIL